MNEMISYCGLLCNECGAFVATKNNDDEKRAELAQLWSKQSNTEYTLEDITDCDGCKTEGGRLFSGCSKCQVRKCARKKGVENCAHCDEYVCEKLKEFFVKDTEAKGRLDVIRAAL